MERAHAQCLMELTSRHQLELETERLHSTQLQAERSLESRERAHKQCVKDLEDQMNLLKEQLGQEVWKRQSYLTQVLRTGK
ncbi:unnamed protein product [Caretta caretta]